MTSISSLSSSSYSTSYKSSLDKNGDGVVSADELAADSSSSSSSLSSKSSVFSTTSSSDSSGEDTVTSALDKLSALVSSLMLQMTSGESQPQPQSGEGGSGDDFLTALDADGDGALSETEFLAGKPEEVSDTDSANLFSSLDTDGNGSLSADELAAQQQPEGPPPPPPMGGPMGAASTDDTESDSTSTEAESSTVDFLEQLESVISSYLENLGGDTDQTQTLLAA